MPQRHAGAQPDLPGFGQSAAAEAGTATGSRTGWDAVTTTTTPSVDDLRELLEERHLAQSLAPNQPSLLYL